MAAAELKEGLLPPIPSTSSSYSTSANVSSSRRLFFPGMDVIGLKKRGQGLRSWIRVDARTGISQSIELDKFAIMRRCDLPARDIRLLDPLFLYPSTILGRERAIVVNLEQIRCIITADEVLLVNSLDPYVLQYVEELGRRIAANKGQDTVSFGGRAALPDYLPFEFGALEAALEAACTSLDSQIKISCLNSKRSKQNGWNDGSALLMVRRCEAYSNDSPEV
ncbi:hypothetical protein KFK09_012484 [Dendrobium nobile]|uniref:Magnesium transporter n=1 Tax=Dendrobium nobile TaxID=94219 RepID=A0A8T3BHU7_DENNO|nr:hypothetical protein KFK09_012484 [Dendrobium nobile]